MRDLSPDDVVSTGSEDPCLAFGLGSTFQLNELILAAIKAIGHGKPPLASKYWFTETGVYCKVLRTQGGGWKSGKIRFRVEFIPDEPEVKPEKPNSPLDDLRTNLDI